MVSKPCENRSGYPNLESEVSERLSKETAVLQVTIEDESGPMEGRCTVYTDEERVSPGETDYCQRTCPGVFFGQSLEVTIPSDKPVHIKVEHGFNYTVWRDTVTAGPGQRVKRTAKLRRCWQPDFWYCGESHSHVCRGPRTHIMNPSCAFVAQVCRSDGLDYYEAGHPWPSPSGCKCLDSEGNWLHTFGTEAFQRLKETMYEYSDQSFTLSPGCEFPKTRYGHLCWVNLQHLCGVLADYMDESWENWLFQSKPGETHRDYPYQLAPYHEVIAHHHGPDTFVYFAHPTSWWWQDGKFVPNIAAELSFLTMAGPLYDGLVVMGYQADHLYYQTLWFNLLNKGYRITGVAEVDACWGRPGFDGPGKYRNYTYAPESSQCTSTESACDFPEHSGLPAGLNREVDTSPLSLRRIARSLKKGRNIATSGPWLMLQADGCYLPGDTCPLGRHELQVEAHAAGDEREYLTYVLIFRNGELLKTWDLRGKALRHFRGTLETDDDSPSWYLAKCYGSDGPNDPLRLDVQRFLENNPFYSEQSPTQVAITNPIYVRPKGFHGPSPKSAHLRCRVFDSQTQKPINAVAVISDNSGMRQLPCNGAFETDVPLTATVEVNARGYKPMAKSVRFDCPQIAGPIEELHTGSFAAERYHPGQVPWKAFAWKQLEKALSCIEWHFPLERTCPDE